MKHAAITGPMVGKRLQKIPAKRTSWQRWIEEHPKTKVLSTDTGYRRNYDIDPYEGYYRALGIMFPVGEVRKDLPAKEMVLGIEIEGAAKAYPLSVLAKNRGQIEDTLSDSSIQIILSDEGQVVDVLDSQRRSIPTVFAYWFAWQAFYPDTTVYVAKK